MNRQKLVPGLVLLLLLVGCIPGAKLAPTPMPALATATSGPPTPVVIVVTATPQPTLVVVVVTATPQPTSTLLTPMCVVAADALHRRSGPGTVYPRTREALPRRTNLEPLARSPDATWVKVRVQGTGEIGWVDAGYVACNIDPFSLPLTEIPSPPTAPAVAQWEVRSLLVGPGSPARLYAFLETVTSGPIEYRLLASDDLGDNWYAFPGGLPDQPAYIHSIDMDYQKLDALYASTSSGLYRWTGRQWVPLSPEVTSGIGSVAVAYGQPNTLWGADGGKPGRLMRSDDGGNTWRVLVTPTNVYDLGLDPRDNAVLYGMVQPSAPFANLYRYADGVWEGIPPPQNQNFGSGLTIDGRTGDLYVTTGVTPWATEPAALWRSTNARASNVNEVHWEKIHEFEQGVNVKLLASGHTASGLMLFANFESAADPQAPAKTYRSLDGGHSWVKLTIP